MPESDFLDGLEGEALFDPDEDVLVPPGKYPAHIKSLSIYPRKTRYASNADVYIPMYQIAEEAGENAGVLVRDVGVWRFTATKNPDTKKIKAGRGNLQYKRLLEILGMEIPEVKDSYGKVIYRLPKLLESDIAGKPVVIDVFHEEWKGKHGEMCKAAKARLAHVWSDGKPLE